MYEIPKVTVELNMHDANTLLHALEQAHLRAEETIEKCPEPGFVIQQKQVMDDIHNLAIQLGEKIKELPYIDKGQVDYFTSMCMILNKKVR